MKKVTLIAVVAFTTIFSSFKTSETSTWMVDKAHAKLGFTITHMMVSEVEGWFKIFDAKVTASNDDFTDAMVEMTADATSINTDNEKRDGHLKSPDFFDTQKFHDITFKSTSFKKKGENYVVTGNLTMRGVTKTVELNAVCRKGMNMQQKPIAGFKITGTINRKDFGIGASMPSAALSDEVSIIANAEFVKN